MAVPFEQFVKHLEDNGMSAGDSLKGFLPPLDALMGRFINVLRKATWTTLVLLLALARWNAALAAEPAPPLSERNVEVPFCYARTGLRSWPILRRRLESGEELVLTARVDGKILGSGRRITVERISLTADDQLTVDARSELREGLPLSLELEVACHRGGRVVQSQKVQLRAAPPPRPISYVADLLDDLIRIYSEPQAGRFRPLEKDGFDQYFRRLQAHGVRRLIVWHSPFPYFTNLADHADDHWQRYARQATAIIGNAELNQVLAQSRALPSWLWMRFVLELRLKPDAGLWFAQSAFEHGISLTASFRPFEAALTKYYEVPTFDATGEYLWGFLPLAMPVVNYAPEQVCFAHYRVVLDSMGKKDAGQLATLELPGVTDAEVAALIDRFGPTGGFELRAARFPPIAADSFVLVRDVKGEYELRRFRDIRDAAEGRRKTITGFRLERGPDRSPRLTGISAPDDLRFIMLTHVAAPAEDGAQAVSLDKEVPVELWSQAGNRLNRETTYWVFDEATPAGRESRIAGITPEAEYRAVFQACTSSINTLLARPQRIPLPGSMVVIDRGDRWSVEMLDFQQPASRQMAIAQLKTLLALGRDSRPDARQPAAYDEIFINTRSHVDLAPTVADGEDGQRLLAYYYRTKRPYLHHLGLDKAYAPRQVAGDIRLLDAAKSLPGFERITTWQKGEWRQSCQELDSPFVWRLARNLAVADGVTRLLRDIEREFPGIRVRAVVPPRERTITRLQDALAALPAPGGGTYGRDYYRRLWCSNNHIPTIGEGMALVDLTGTRVEPVFLGSGGYSPDREPFALFVREQIADMQDNRGSQFRGPRSYFYEGQFTLRASDLNAARRDRELMIRHLLSQKNEIAEVLLYEAADWLYFMPLSDPDLCGHGFLDREEKPKPDADP